MIPILFDSLTTDFSTFGIGHLSDAIGPSVIEERNGEFTLEMQYPLDGEHFSDIEMRSIILAKPSPAQDPQPFRVFRITKPINGIVTINARHVRYDLEGVPVTPFTASGIANALQQIKSNAMVSNPFTFTTNKTNTQTMTLTAPASTLSLLGGVRGSLLDIYGGEYKYNIWNVALLSSRGTDNGVVIRYGVDLTDFQQEENCASVYTGVMCFWKSSQGDTIVTGEVQSSGTFDYSRILVVDKSGEYENAPTVAQLNQEAATYINNNKVGVPKVAINLSFANLEQTEEFKNIRQSIELCDQITVDFPKIGVSAMARVIRTNYDVLNERYNSVEIGDSRTSLADSFVAVQTRVESAPTTAEMQQAINVTTAAITGANGGSVRLLDTNDDDLPDTLYIADNPSPLLASKVWRFNYEGWGASQNGYSGPFTMGATFAQGFLAEFITAGTLNADRIGANTITIDKLTASAQKKIVTSVSTQRQYYLSTSTSSATGGSWSTSIPTWASGKYLWTRDVTTKTFVDNTSETTYSPSANGIYDRNLTTALSTAKGATDTANSANAREQLIYFSERSGIDSVTPPSAWVTRTTDTQNTWTAFRPTYSSSYPVLWVATQRQTVGGTVTCTTPMRDETTTIIDGGHITTGTIDANRVTVTNLNASNITTGTLNAERIGANSIEVSKLSGSIKNNNWNIDFTNGTLTIGNISADKINAGTLNVNRIGSNSIGISKLTGSISADEWKIDLENGTLTIGKISADKISSGTIDASQITVTNLNADNITAGSINGSRIADLTIEGGKLKNDTISGTKLADFAITTSKLDSKAVTGSKIGDLTITGSNIANTTLPGDKLENYTLSDTQVASGGLSTWSTSDGIDTSLGYADFSNDVFNKGTTCTYLYTEYLEGGTTAKLAATSVASLNVWYGNAYFSATFQKPSISLSQDAAFQVKDINGDTRWVSIHNSGTVGSYVLTH